MAIAASMAEIKLSGLARPVPARSNAVPWSGLVRTNGSPSVVFTPCSRPMQFDGDQTLVVVHRHHHIKLALTGSHENCVGRVRA